jgi:hypothetical protein
MNDIVRVAPDQPQEIILGKPFMFEGTIPPKGRRFRLAVDGVEIDVELYLTSRRKAVHPTVALRVFKIGNS